tara:strand:- start:5582 stop:6187 length:606 start_codon:yes stop_codon:yes gene_type:complete
MTKIIVYGTLKKGGRFSSYLRGQKYIQPLKVVGFKMYDSGYGFPFIVKGGETDIIYGELYEVDDKVLKVLDRLESVDSGLYSRLDIQDDFPTIKEPTYIYVSKLSHFDSESVEIPYGYWQTTKKYSKLMRVKIHDKEYENIAQKIVFDMRFFDGDRTPTNESYMKMVEKRLHLPINTDVEEIFLTDLIIDGLVEELTEKVV